MESIYEGQSATIPHSVYLSRVNHKVRQKWEIEDKNRQQNLLFHVCQEPGSNPKRGYVQAIKSAIY